MAGTPFGTPIDPRMTTSSKTEKGLYDWSTSTCVNKNGLGRFPEFRDQQRTTKHENLKQRSSGSVLCYKHFVESDCLEVATPVRTQIPRTRLTRAA
jgi:hypothetical protein